MLDGDSRVRITCASDLRPREVDWLWAGRVPLGMITMFAGDPKLGKSKGTHRREVMPRGIRTGITPVLGSQAHVHTRIGRLHRRDIDGIDGSPTRCGRNAIYVPPMVARVGTIAHLRTFAPNDRSRMCGEMGRCLVRARYKQFEKKKCRTRSPIFAAA